MSITLSEEAKRARREYKRNWQRNNPDKVKAQQARYWQNKANKEKLKNGQTQNSTTAD